MGEYSDQGSKENRSERKRSKRGWDKGNKGNY